MHINRLCCLTGGVFFSGIVFWRKKSHYFKTILSKRNFVSVFPLNEKKTHLTNPHIIPSIILSYTNFFRSFSQQSKTGNEHVIWTDSNRIYCAYYLWFLAGNPVYLFSLTLETHEWIPLFCEFQKNNALYHSYARTSTIQRKKNGQCLA